jgi:uncharacterized protein YjdB
MDNIKLTGNSKLLKKTKSKINPRELALALAEATECGNGINPLKGYVVLPDFNSDSGDVDQRVALYIVDGELVIEPIATAKANISAFCGNAFISATSVTLTGCPTAAILETASPFQLTATVNPTGALQTGTWSSNATGVATVNSSGLVTVVGPGNATITFTSTDGGFTATCVLLVQSVG